MPITKDQVADLNELAQASANIGKQIEVASAMLKMDNKITARTHLEFALNRCLKTKRDLENFLYGN